MMLLAGSVTQVDAKTIYYLNVHDWSTPKIYLYNSGGGELKAWPGSDMTKTDKVYDGHEIYQFEYDESQYDVCIFNQGNDTEKTGDLTIGTGDFYVINSWKNWDDFHESRTIYLNAGAVDWWCNGNAVQKATFKPSNTTVTGTLVDETDKIYEFIIPAGFDTQVLFSRHENETASAWNSTDDIAISSDKNYVTSFSEGSDDAIWGTCYTITYNLDGGTNPADAPKVYDGSTVITLPRPTKTDYVFNDWFDNAQLTGSAVRKITVGSTGNKEFWAKWDEPVWRIVGFSDQDSWEKPIDKGIELTNAYGSVYYYHYDGSASSTFRVACGSQQYHTNGVTVPSTGETHISLTARIKGANDQTSVSVSGACYICINTETMEIWYQSSVPSQDENDWSIVGFGNGWTTPVPMTHVYGDVYFYKFTDNPDDVDDNYFRIVKGNKQYCVDITGDFSNTSGVKAIRERNGDVDASKAAGSGYLCFDAFNSTVWMRSEIPTARTVYFLNNDNYDDVYCYAYHMTDASNSTNNGAWPGRKMIPVGNNIYKFDVPQDYDLVIFNNGKSGSASGEQQVAAGSIMRSENFYTYENGDWTWSTYYAEPGLIYTHSGETDGDACFVPFDAKGKVTLTFTKDMATTFSVFDRANYRSSSEIEFTRGGTTSATLGQNVTNLCSFTADVTGDYVFTYNSADHTISVDYPFATNVLPTAKKESGKIAFLSKVREGEEKSQVVRGGWFWYVGQEGVAHHMLMGGAYNGKTISYYDNKFGFSNCLPLQNSPEDNDDSWDVGVYTKSTSTGTKNGDGDVLKKDATKYIDNIMYYEITEVKQGDYSAESGDFIAFSHLTAKVLTETVNVLKGANVSLAVSDVAGTLSVPTANNYIVYAVNSNGVAQRLFIGNVADGNISFYAPSVAGQYKMHVFVQDPYGFELIEPYEEPITLIVNEQTYKVTYAKGDDSVGGVAPIDNNAYLSGAEAIVLGNTGKLTKAGYNFIGWNTAADGSGTSYPVGSSITLGTEDVTLYPQWVNKPVPTISANYPSGTNFQSATDVIFTVTDANDVNYYSVANDGTETPLTLTDGKYNVASDVTIKVVATNYNGTDGDTSDDVTVTRVFKYTVGNVDEGAYYLVSPTLTGGKKLEQYKFNNVLHRDADNNVDQNLLTLTVSDFMMHNLIGSTPEDEYPDYKEGDGDVAKAAATIEYWIEKGDGTVVYYPKGGKVPGSTYYPGFNDPDKRYVYVYNTQYPKDHQMYVCVNGGKEQAMTFVADAKADGKTGFWCYELGSDDSYVVAVNDMGISSEAQMDLKSHSFTVTGPTQIVLSEFGNQDHAGYDHFNVVTAKASIDDSENVSAGDYALGFEDEKWFDAGELVDAPLSHTFVYTKTQTETYPVSCNDTKNPTDVPAEDERFTLTKTVDQKSYTWYLNLGAEPYENSKHFTVPSNGVAIAINNSIDDLHAIKEVTTSDGKYSYSLIGNTTKDSKNWADPATSKLEMQRIGFKGGKSFVLPGETTAEECDSIVYTITITKPVNAEGVSEWSKLFMAFTDQNTIDNFQQNDQWYQTPIRPQVFDNKDANVYFGGLEWNGVNTGDGTYENEIGDPTDQTITPKNIDQFTSFVLHVNVTNATYWIAFNGETENPEEGFFICGPAVAADADDANHKNWIKKIKGENLDKTPNAAISGNAVRMTYDAATESYVATLKLTYGEKFRFLDTSWDKAYYEEDAILPARDGEPSDDAAWEPAGTWETDYFNNTTNALTSTSVVDDGAITFKLQTGEYTVRFYFKKIKTAEEIEGKEVFTYDATPYYTIDYHIGIGDAEDFGTDINKGAGSAFAFHKTWSSRLAYVNNGLDAYYVNGWNWIKDEQKNTATASVTLSKMEKPAYLAAEMPMILTDDAKHPEKLYIIVPGDPYGKQAAVRACKHLYSGTGINVRPIYETEDYSDAMTKSQDDDDWKKWTEKVGPGAFNGEKYTTRNFTFAMIKPSWRNDSMKELDFWRVSSTNGRMTGHKFLVVANVPAETDDLESGHAFTTYQTGTQAKSMANYMTIRFEGEDDDNDSIVTGIAENIAEKADNSRIYNLMGVEVKTPVRGQVYIVNGRKTIMK